MRTVSDPMVVVKRAEGVRLLVTDQSPLQVAGFPVPADERWLTWDFAIAAADDGFVLSMTCREEDLYQESRSADLGEVVAEGELWGVPPGAWSDERGQ